MHPHLFRKSLPATFPIALAVASMMLGGFLAPAAGQTESNDKIKDLQKKRIVALTEIHKLSLQAFKGGQFEFKRVLEARAAMLGAQLDLAETKTERIKIHEQIVQTAEENVKNMRKLVAGSQLHQLDALKAEVQLLDAKIALEKAKAVK